MGRAAQVTRRRAGAATPSSQSVFELQRLAGNAAVRSLLNTQSGPPQVLQRVLTPADVGNLTPVRDAVLLIHNTQTARIPARIIGQANVEHPSMDRIRAATMAINNAAATPDTFGPLNAGLQTARQELDVLRNFLDQNLDLLTSVHQLYDTFSAAAPAGGAGAGPHPLAAVTVSIVALNGELQGLANALLENRGSVKAFSDFRLKLERLVLPDNKAMQKLRATNAQQATEVLTRLIDGGLVTSDNLSHLYKSPFDKGKDKFGASWSLAMTGASGKGQWLREWEYHVHARADRAAGVGTPVTGFTVTVGHIKPSADPYALGVSIDVQNPAFTGHIQNDYQAKVVRWANSDKGSALLAMKG